MTDTPSKHRGRRCMFGASRPMRGREIRMPDAMWDWIERHYRTLGEGVRACVRAAMSAETPPEAGE